MTGWLADWRTSWLADWMDDILSSSKSFILLNNQMRAMNNWMNIHKLEQMKDEDNQFWTSSSSTFKNESCQWLTWCKMSRDAILNEYWVLSIEC
jgi:hypothetical protein